MTRPQILLDCDGVLADFVGGLLARLKRAGQIEESVQVGHVTQWNIANALGISWETVNSLGPYRPGFVEDLQPYPGSAAFVSALRELGDVTIATSPYTGAYHWIPERLEWLQKHYGFAAADVCVWGRKERITGDILVDDSLENAKAFAATGRPVTLVARPWNRGTFGGLVARCEGYDVCLKDVKTALALEPHRTAGYSCQLVGGAE